MTKEECFEILIKNKGMCAGNINCKLCYFNINITRFKRNKNNARYHCYAFRFDWDVPTNFLYNFSLHYMTKKVRKMKEILK